MRRPWPSLAQHRSWGAGRTHTGAEDLPAPSSGAPAFPEPRARPSRVRAALAPLHPTPCKLSTATGSGGGPETPGARARGRPRGAGALGLRPATARPAQPPPRPHSPAQPPGGTRRERVASPADRQKLRGVAGCLGRPDFASRAAGEAPPPPPRSLRGLPPACRARSAAGEGRGGGRGRLSRSDLCEGLDSEENKTKWTRQGRPYRR